MPNLNRLLTECFRFSKDLVPFEIHRQLVDLFEGESILVTNDCDFDLAAFAEDGRCMIWDSEEMSSLYLARWQGREKGAQLNPKHAFLQIQWNCQKLQCLTVEVDSTPHHFIIAKTLDLARSFFSHVCQYATDAEGSVIVFDGRFRRNPALETGVKGAKWDDLVLPHPLKVALRENVISFFESRELYERYNVPWKRGILLYGPPGNGKTHAVKALVAEVGRPCIVVRSLRMRNVTEEKLIAHLFNRARELAPAILLFEDIDSLVSKTCLSALLNEMDGMASNAGLMCIATTNYLAKLDPALANRPSRFDCKFNFGNLRKDVRVSMLRKRLANVDAEMRPSEQGIIEAADSSRNFSGAMMQEVIRASVMGWIRRPLSGSMDALLAQEVDRIKPKPAPIATSKSSRKGKETVRTSKMA